MRTRPCLEYEGRIGHGYSNNYNYNDNNSPGAGLCAGRSRLRAAVRCGRGQAGGCSGGQLQLSRGWGGRALALPLEAMPVSWRSASLGKLQQQPWPGSEEYCDECDLLPTPVAMWARPWLCWKMNQMKYPDPHNMLAAAGLSALAIIPDSFGLGRNSWHSDLRCQSYESHPCYSSAQPPLQWSRH